MTRKRFKMKYLKQVYHRYHKSNNKDKTKILDEFCKVCGYVRKYAIRQMNASLPDKDPPKPTQPEQTRQKKYLKKTF